ncbi:circadian clock protein KaiC [Marivibrio halodurans]|uniref:non-specific serine/threonine protein kinase n=1 Tax=Marivibrio halodurans TaxID=2039722 RepID=A0A8J7V1R0_9PROT|nr:circadian clock protein KaiC [Marivibrio halodurans]
MTPFGIPGLDQILGGGLPRRRAVLATGGAGSGKTILGLEFLIRGATQFDEAGVLVSFEESRDELVENAAGFGWDIEALERDGSLRVVCIDIQGAAQGVETGKFDLAALSMRIDNAAAGVNAKRIVLDGLNNLLSAFRDEQQVRTELLGLFRHLKNEGLTIVATGERGINGETRLGFEEYLADGLIVLTHRIDGRIAKRTLRVAKCRGIAHATDEFPIMLGNSGIVLFPIGAVDEADEFAACEEIISTGVPGLDAMLEPGGFYRGGSILIGGAAGTGKSSLGARFVEAACERGERAILFSFEESPAQMARNMRTISIDLQRWIDNGALECRMIRPQSDSPEAHLATMMDAVRRHDPDVAVLDPISALTTVGHDDEIRSMLARMVDFFRASRLTTMMTNLAAGGRTGEAAELAVSSLADAWILVRRIEQNAERNNIIQVLKSRGMSHSNSLCEFDFTKDGIAVREAYIGVDGVVLGSARHAAEAKDRMRAAQRQTTIDASKAELQLREQELESRIAELRLSHEAQTRRLEAAIREAEDADGAERAARDKIADERS